MIRKWRDIGLRAMQRLILTGVIAALALPVMATDFLQFVEDLPLAPGLVEDVGASVVFDKPNGRIVRTKASGPPPSATIVSFYRQTLPELGWQPDPRSAKPGRNSSTDLRFVRAREILSVRIGSDGRDSVVYFAITPR